MLLNRDDIEFMWNEVSIYLHFVLVAVFLFTSLYAWHISKIIAFIIGAATLLFLGSAVGSVFRRNNMTKIKQYTSKKFMNEMYGFFHDHNCIEPDQAEKITEKMQLVIEQAYKRGYYDGRRN